MNDEKMKKGNKIILISGISVASVTLLATIISAFFTPKAPDPKELGPRTKVAYMASKQFARLPEKEKTAYIKKLGRSSMKEYRNLSSAERNAVVKNTIKVKKKEIKKRLNKFFAMSKEEQNKRLDKMIAKWNEAKKNRKNNVSQSKKDSKGNKHDGNINAWKQGFLENTNSTTRAQISEFFRRLKERSKQTQGK